LNACLAAVADTLSGVVSNGDHDGARRTFHRHPLRGLVQITRTLRLMPLTQALACLRHVDAQQLRWDEGLHGV
jgi:hypothetical protein